MSRFIRAFVGSVYVAVLALFAMAPPSLAASPHLLGLGVPVAVNDAYGTPAQTTLVVPARGVLTNDTDLLGTNLTARLVSNPTHGNLTLAADGGFTYQPDGGFSGVDTFTYRAVDGLPSLNVGTVSITVAPRLSTPTPAPTPTPTPRPTPTPTPIRTPGPTPVPTLALPTLPLPTLPLPTLPLPTLPLPTPPPTLPVATPTLPPLPVTTPIPSTLPVSTPAPSGSPKPSLVAVVPGSSAPPPSSGPGAGGPIASVGGPTSGGTFDEPTIAGLGPGAAPISIGSLGDLGSGIEWIVPSVVVTLPGFLLIIFGLAQVFGGFMFLPVARRWLRGDGRRSGQPFTHDPT